jgi:5'-methylthioadenosine phosphorylase
VTTPPVAIIGGTGFYELLADATQHSVQTPYGQTSAPIAVGEVAGRPVAFVPRHGSSHEYLPAQVPYRANLWALRELGATQIIGFNTVGSLRRDYRIGDIVLCDQFIDRTYGRQDTIFDHGDVGHISTADPYCLRLRAIAIDALADGVGRVHPTATVVVTQGPRFSTRAESAWFAAMGWHVLNQTQYPEAVLARELEVCYMNVSYVTDYDVAAKEVVGEEDAEIVTHHAVVAAFRSGSQRTQEVIRRLVTAFPETADCTCRTALKEARA